MRNKVLESRGAIWSLVMRGIEIVWNLGFYWSTLVYDCFVGRDEEVVPFRAMQLRNLLCDLGPSFIKAGQVRRISAAKYVLDDTCVFGGLIPSSLNFLFHFFFPFFRFLQTDQILLEKTT